MAYLEIEIEGGDMKIEGHGFEGPMCEELAKLFEDMGTVTSKRRKPEYSRTQHQSQRIRQRQ